MIVKFGMVGTGAMAAIMLPAFRHAEGAELAAVASRSEDRARMFALKHKIPSARGSLEELLTDQSIHAVYIANATKDHAETSIAALNAGKHVLCEKPFAMTAADGARVIEAAKASGKLFMEGLWTHFLPAYERVRQIAYDKDLGEPLHLTASYGFATSEAARPRLYDRQDGGVILDLGVYPVSLALRLMGPVKSLEADVKRNNEGVDTHVSLFLRHERGGVSQLAMSFDAWLSNAASLACTDGLVSIPSPLFGAETVIAQRFGTAEPVKNNNAGEIKSALKRIPLLRRVKQALGRGERHPFGADPYLPQMDHFTGLVTAGKTESDVVTHDFSLDVLRILDRIRAQEGDRS